VKVLILGHDDVVALLPMGACVDVMAQALAARARRQVTMPLRQVMWLEDHRGALAFMPAHLRDGEGDALGVKMISVFPGNSATPYDSHQGPVLLFDAEHGRLLAVLDASSVTAIRTAAVSGVATRALARPEAAELAVIGTGTLSTLHVAAVQAVRPIRRVRVWGRSAAKAERVCEQVRQAYGLETVRAETVEAAVRDADVVCTVTAADRPVVEGGWLAPGTHLNAVGASVPGFRELDTEVVRRSRLYVDARESALSEADEIRLAVADASIGEDHIVGELGDVLVDAAPGRGDPAEVTMFKSCGLAVEDVAAARYAYGQAVATGRGTWVEFAAQRGAH